MPPILKQIWANVYLRFILIALGVYLLYRLLVLTEPVWISFLVAFLLAYLLDPLVSLVAKRSNRAVGVLAIVACLLVFLGLLWLLGIQIGAQISTFSTQLPNFMETVQDLPYRISRWIDPSFGSVFERVYVTLQSFAQRVTSSVLPALENFSSGQGGLTRSAIGLVGGVTRIVITLVLSAYLLYNFPRYTRSFLRALPHRHRPFVETLVTYAGRSVGGYIRAQLLIAAIVGFLTFIGLSLVGIPLAPALGLLAGLGNLVPFLGPILTAIPTLFLGLLVGGNHVLWALLVLVAVNQLDGHVLSPLIFSRTVELDPVTVIVAIVLGDTLFGLVGAIIAVPVAVFLKVLFSEYYVNSGWYKRPGSPPKA